MKQRRIGNFCVEFVSRKDVPVLEVSNVERTWLVRLPFTSDMYSVIKQALEDGEAGEIAVGTFISAWHIATMIPQGHFVKALFMLFEAYAEPSLLKKPSLLRKGRNKDYWDKADELRKSFIAWAKEAERVARDGITDEDIRRDELADGAREIIGDNG